MNKYSKKLEELFLNENIVSDNCGPHLIEIFGENFVNVNYELKDIVVEVKAFIEKQIDLFMLYKC